MFKVLHLLEEIRDDDGWNETRLKRDNPEFAKMVDKDRADRPNRTFRGAGRFTHVDQSDSPHEMDNVDRTTSSKMDGGHFFYKALADNNSFNNPYFPRVNAAGTKGGGKYPTYNVEKLQPLNKFEGNDLLLRSLLEQMFTNFNPESYAEGEITPNIFVLELKKRFSAPLINEKLFRDPKLYQAAKIVQKLTDDYAQFPDIHAGNVMFRMTGNQPHMVIADPMYNPYQSGRDDFEIDSGMFSDFGSDW